MADTKKPRDKDLGGRDRDRDRGRDRQTDRQTDRSRNLEKGESRKREKQEIGLHLP